ncbi:hypothetical protein CYMTET_7640 [Cymbomonas tetramitiformis]|uniref:Uncharacterized protein n=1 Tax=Cymbomonas tetramitiformis TaxID=36881 RepID=A0AAE0GUN1_9CHLO|nr:hypothetical protein CYMTET_7640 [Cymbomonas tetramitiformis]
MTGLTMSCKLWMQAFGMVIMNNHPWMKIAVVGACEPYTRSQRILTEVNSILMMLLCCLWFFYSRVNTCCGNLRVELGCSAAESTLCHGVYTCRELRIGFECDRDLTCPVHEQLPGGFSCTAFPQNSFIDKIWLAVYIVMMNVPLKLFFVTLFTVGGSVKTPDHWNAGMQRQVEKVVGSSSMRWVEHVMFLVYAMLFDHMHLSRALARIFSGLLLLLDSSFLGMRLVASKAWKQLKHLRQSLWFLIQVK